MRQIRQLRHRYGKRWAAARLAALVAAFGLAGVVGLVGVFGLAAPALAARSVVPLRSALALPQYIGVLDYMGERSRADSRPGGSYSYRAAGLALDIDVYDYAAARLPDGIASKLLEREFVRMQRSLPAGSAQLIRAGTIALGGAASTPAIPAREAVFARRGASFDGTSYLWIAARGGRLYEMRFDVSAGFEDDGRVSRSEALAALGQAIARPSEVPSAASVPPVDVSILWDPATPPSERPLWTAYLYTRAALVAAESEDVAFPSGDHAASFNEEFRGRLIAVNLYRQLRRRDPAFKSDYFADLDRVEASGFLREYIWQYLRKPAWTEPGGLRLAAFDAWRAAHLRNHVAETYGRIAVRLAAK